MGNEVDLKQKLKKSRQSSVSKVICGNRVHLLDLSRLLHLHAESCDKHEMNQLRPDQSHQTRETLSFALVLAFLVLDTRPELPEAPFWGQLL